MKTVGLVFKKKSGGRRSTEPDKEQQSNTATQPSETQKNPNKED